MERSCPAAAHNDARPGHDVLSVAANQDLDVKYSGRGRIFRAAPGFGPSLPIECWRQPAARASGRRAIADSRLQHSQAGTLPIMSTSSAASRPPTVARRGRVWRVQTLQVRAVLRQHRGGSRRDRLSKRRGGGTLLRDAVREPQQQRGFLLDFRPTVNPQLNTSVQCCG
jgi:hypothetical protein